MCCGACPNEGISGEAHRSAASVPRSMMAAYTHTHTHNNAVETLTKIVRVATWYVSGCLCAALQYACVAYTHTNTHTHNNAVQTLIKIVRVATWYVSGCLCAALQDACVAYTHTQQCSANINKEREGGYVVCVWLPLCCAPGWLRCVHTHTTMQCKH